MKLKKGNMLFIEDPKILEFIKYCKETYSDKIENINIFLNEEYSDWQITVKEKIPGLMWVSWYIPIIAPTNLDKSRYSLITKK
jgi:hypothetical protein